MFKSKGAFYMKYVQITSTINDEFGAKKAKTMNCLGFVDG